MKLYDIAADYRRLLAKADETDGELTESWLAELDRIEGDLAQKSDSYSVLIREWEVQAECFQTEAKRLLGKANTYQERAKRLRQMLLDGMKAMHLDAIQGRRFRVTRRLAGTPAIRWEGDPEQMPEEFQRWDVRLNYQRAKEFLEYHGALPEGFTVTHTEFVQIR